MAQKMASAMALDYLRVVAAPGRRENFPAVLNRAPDAQPSLATNASEALLS